MVIAATNFLKMKKEKKKKKKKEEDEEKEKEKKKGGKKKGGKKRERISIFILQHPKQHRHTLSLVYLLLVNESTGEGSLSFMYDAMLCCTCLNLLYACARVHVQCSKGCRQTDA
jgi:hypothetical protein